MEKPWYASKGVWGSLIATLAGFGALFGYEIPLPDQNAAADAVAAIEKAIVAKDVVGALAAAGGLLALIGRLFAVTGIARVGGAGPAITLIEIMGRLFGRKPGGGGTVPALLFALIAAGVLIAACTMAPQGATVRQQLAVAELAFTETIEALTAARKAELISKPQAQRLVPIVQGASAALDTAQAAIIAKETEPIALAYVEAARGVIAELATLVTTLKNGGEP